MQTQFDHSVKILTNHWGQKSSQTWKSVTTYVPPSGTNFISSFRLAVRLYSERLHYDCIVLGAGQSDTLFCLLQSILPFKRMPCVLIDCLWSRSTSRLMHGIKKTIFKIVSQSVDRFVVWASHETSAFANTFDLPESKFSFIPYHTTFESHKITSHDDDYIFCGGNSERDYDALIKAVRDLPLKVIIASTIPANSLSVSIPDNVTMRGMRHQEFIAAMAGCRINIVPLAASRLRSAGQQTFLNSMLLGKPTIVTDVIGPIGYIENGEDGLLVQPDDPDALREAIMMLVNNPEKARNMGKKAMRKANEYSTELHFKKIVKLVQEVIKTRQSRTYNDAAMPPALDREKDPL